MYKTFIALGAFLLSFSGCALGQANVEVDGLGWIGDRRMNGRLAFLLGVEKEKTIDLDSALLEDSAFLLLEQMRRRGYLRPSIRGRFETVEGQAQYEWGTPYEIQLPVEFTAEQATFHIVPGRLYYYDAVEIEGLGNIDLDDVERFFIPGGSLFTRKKDLAYTRENFERRTNRLLAALEAMGYVEAKVGAESVAIDEETGAVSIELKIDPGPMYMVGSVEVEISGPRPDWLNPPAFETGTVFNREWLRQTGMQLRHAAYGEGYPDAKVRHELLAVEAAEGGAQVRQSVRYELIPGPQVNLGGVRFEGDPSTSRAILHQHAGLEEGAPLDPRRTDRARRRLMGLDIFNGVETSFEAVSEQERVVLYHLDPSVRRELQLLGGWGSYEQARVGFQWSHKNPWGRAHRYSAKVKQSMKASRVQGNYRVPQVLGTHWEAYTEAEYSRREEIGYDRSRHGVLAGVTSLLGESGWRMSWEYGWFAEEADGIDDSGLRVDDDARVASLSLNLSLDRRDNPLSPTSGYDVFANVKTANRLIGGNVDFQKIEFGGSFHRPLADSTILHFGLRTGALMGDDEELPFVERFFPGGENSVRGYREGEASPLDPTGDPVGAQVFWRGNLEIEERLIRELSVIAFVDVVGVSRDGRIGSADVLASAGLGLRYNTVVGPVRLEYGHNLNPREEDPGGTLHFSIGYPF